MCVRDKVREKEQKGEGRRKEERKSILFEGKKEKLHIEEEEKGKFKRKKERK